MRVVMVVALPEIPDSAEGDLLTEQLQTVSKALAIPEMKDGQIIATIYEKAEAILRIAQSHDPHRLEGEVFMNFSDALDACKSGHRISRAGWNGPGQFVVHQKGYPNGIAINENTSQATGLDPGTVCKFAPYLMICNAQGVFVPWLASQEDLLAEDWLIA